MSSYRLAMKQIIFLALFLSLTARAEATYYWVAPTGSNANSCGAVSSGSEGTDPGVYKQTITNAATCMNPGDTVIVKDGTYNEVLDVTASGTAGNLVSLKSQNPRGATISPANNGTGGQAVFLHGAYTSF